MNRGSSRRLPATDRRRFRAGLRAGTVLMLLAGLAGTVPALGQPSGDEVSGTQAGGLMAEADRAREAGRLQEAVELYRSVVRLHPEERSSRWYLCAVLYDLGRHAEAMEEALEITERWPDFGPGHAILGLALFQLGDYPAALARFQEARIRGFGREKELQRTARFFAAVALNRLGKFEAAYQALRGFAYENRRTPNVLNALGLCMLRLPYLPWEVPPERKEVIQRVGEATFAWESGSRERSRELFAQLLAEYPTLPHLRYSWGLLVLSSDPGEALELFLRELELAPDHLPALVEVASEYIRRGDYNEAAPYAAQVRQVEPMSFAGPFLLGQVLLETGSELEALELLEEAVRRAPARPETHFVLGRAYQRLGRREDAQKQLREFERLRTLMKEAEEFLTERDYSVTRETQP